MYENVPFYDLSKERQRRLIGSKRVATSEGILTEIPEGEPPVRVFEKPLQDMLLSRLETGRFTLNELADELNINEADVRKVINIFRRHGRDDFTGEIFTLNLLSEWNGVIRVKGVSGVEFEYTLEKIPYHARIADPTLVMSLLDQPSKVLNLPVMADRVPANTVSEIDETYALLFGDFWDIDPQEIFDEITRYDRTYVETSVAPLPILRDDDVHEKVRERFDQPDTVYDRYRNIERTARRVTDEFLETVNRGQPGVRMYQAVAIDLFDLLRGAKMNEPGLVPEIQDSMSTVVSTLHPDTGGENVVDSGDRTTVALEEELLAVLGDDWLTPEEIYDGLPIDVRMETSRETVRETLSDEERFGRVASRGQNEDVEYNLKYETYI